MQDYTYHIDTIILQTTARQVCRFAQAHTNSCKDHGADIQPQSQQPCPKLCVRKVSPWEKKKQERLIDGGLVMKWRHQGAWRGEEGGWERAWKQAEREWERERERGGKRGIRRIAFRLCSIKGEITHLLRFFLKTTAPIDQTAWMYRPIFNMKYRHQKSITPVFSLPSPIYSSLSLFLTKVDASTSLSPLLSKYIPVSLFLRGYESPTVSLWHVHYVICRYICLTNGEVDHIQ